MKFPLKERRSKKIIRRNLILSINLKPKAFKYKLIAVILSIGLGLFSNSLLSLYSSYFGLNNALFQYEHKLKTSDVPIISIISPINYTLFGMTPPNYSISISEELGNYTWYQFIDTDAFSEPIELEGIENEVFNGTFDETMWSNLENGTVKIRFYVNNSLNEIGQVDAIIRLDIIKPVISVLYPTTGFFNSTPPDFSVEISDPNLDKMWYTLNTNSTKHLFVENGTIDTDAWNFLDDGPVDINFYANDSVSNEQSFTVQVTKDTTNPMAPINLIVSPPSWTRTNSFNITWSNPSDPSGIIGAYYKLETEPLNDTDGTYVAGINIESISGISVGSNGIHNIYVWLKDSVGNINHTFYATSQLYLDNEMPDSPIDLQISPSSWTNVDKFNISWTNPSDLSGIVGAYYKLNSLPTNNTDGVYISGEDIKSIDNIAVGSEGIHTIYVWLNDSAGNINYNNSAVGYLYLDISAPDAPVNIQVNPSSWTNVNSFNLSWTNPSDLSDIVGAYYKLNSEPSNNTDGIYVPGLNIQSITSIVAESDGIHTIYLWLKDSAGNIDYINLASIEIYLDSTDPLAPLELTVTPDSWTNINSFNLSWMNPSDLSGIVGAYYKLDTLPTNNTDGVYISGVDIVSLNEIMVNSNGTHIIYIWLRDSAGNVNHSNRAYVFLYLDAICPSIEVNQEGDEIWRNSPGTTYDVDFIDPGPSSTLDYAQYKITSNQNQGGVVLLDWIYIFQDYEASSFTLDWTIDFDACQEGINWISVRIFDDAGNYATLNDTFYVKKDTLTPNLTINSPQNNSRWKSPPDIQLTASDINLDTIWYIFGTVKILLTNGVSEPLDSTIWDSLANEQKFIIHFFANDSAGNVNNTFSHTLYKDILAPRITIHNPINETYYGTPPPIHISVFDISSVFINYTVTGYSPASLQLYNNSEVFLDPIIWDQLPQGEFELVISAYDALLNRNESRLVLFKDSIAPSVFINSPNNHTWCKLPPIINVDAFDINFDSLWYQYNTSLIELSNGIDQMFDDSIWDTLEEGPFIIEIFANDTLGNLNNSYYLTLYKDTIAPDLVINSPENLTKWKEPPYIKVTSNDTHLDSIWYIVDSTKIILTNGLSERLCDCIWDELEGEQAFTIYFYANDTAGNINDTFYYTLYKDILPPRVFINSPTNQTYFNMPPLINVTVFDNNFHSLSYTVLGYYPVINLLVNNTGVSLNEDIWEAIPDGKFELVISAFDTLENVNETILTLFKDTTPPQIIVNTPSNYTIHGSPPILNVNALDPNLDLIWYQYNGEMIPIADGVDQMLESSIWDILAEGSFTLEFFANDTYGYLSTSVKLTLIKDTIKPQIIINSPENNTYFSSQPILNIDAIDLHIDRIWYRVAETTIFLQGGDESLDEAIWSSLPQGEFRVYLFANDSAGNLNDSMILTLYKDTLAPFLVVNSPQNNSYWNSVPVLNITVYDMSPSTIFYNVSGYSVQIENNTDSFFNYTIWSNLPEGIFMIEFYAIDSLGNRKDPIPLLLCKDTVKPIININLPHQNDIFGEIPPAYDITIIEDHLNTTWYTLIGVSIEIRITEFTGIINQSLWDMFGNESITIRFYANDSAGNNIYNQTIVRKNIYAPVITILSPISYQLFGKSPPSFTIYKSGPEIQSTWYTIDNGITNYTFSGLSGIIDEDAWSEFGYEFITLKFYINDSFGKTGYDEVIISKDPISPTIFIHSPLNQTSFAATPFFNLSVIEPNLHKVWYKVNNTFIDITSNLTQFLYHELWINLAQGTFILEFFANDTLGNINQLNLSLSKDTLGPNISILKPLANQKIDRTAPYFELLINDASDIEENWYSIDDGYTIISFLGLIGKIDQTLWESIWDNRTQGESITLRFYSKDILGNINYEEVNVIKYKEGYIPKFLSDPLGLLVPVIGLGVLLPITAKVTKSRYYHSLNTKERKKLGKVLISAFFFLALILLFYMF